ncbi:hypothetical protein CAOG_04750 [Capsaspora owczarzaki ATCC 30864]|uniref:Uncharacterized protein n=1 Tax=Capsaspora owczarzaki (strain ATCC 30864) TaxID=595528 RepID=A0A0D2WRV9_CAPO3|nr:hypothetical protein CAOG_04750 [Capsaspora owczarzaki ATCC 30864]KJE94053.1 hypothetical protein CAOG_004750 [Capsaspora owczarzaki ATCC 30864]|eukprot:XP_004347501.2 hypothetical protein CAOG_04750 [Capsaspora owczarzaki ATCC 30864]
MASGVRTVAQLALARLAELDQDHAQSATACSRQLATLLHVLLDQSPASDTQPDAAAAAAAAADGLAPSPLLSSAPGKGKKAQQGKAPAKRTAAGMKSTATVVDPVTACVAAVIRAPMSSSSSSSCCEQCEAAVVDTLVSLVLAQDVSSALRKQLIKLVVTWRDVLGASMSKALSHAIAARLERLPQSLSLVQWVCNLNELRVETTQAMQLSMDMYLPKLARYFVQCVEHALLPGGVAVITTPDYSTARMSMDELSTEVLDASSLLALILRKQPGVHSLVAAPSVSDPPALAALTDLGADLLNSCLVVTTQLAHVFAQATMRSVGVLLGTLFSIWCAASPDQLLPVLLTDLLGITPSSHPASTTAAATATATAVATTTPIALNPDLLKGTAQLLRNEGSADVLDAGLAMRRVAFCDAILRSLPLDVFLTTVSSSPDSPPLLGRLLPYIANVYQCGSSDQRFLASVFQAMSLWVSSVEKTATLATAAAAAADNTGLHANAIAQIVGTQLEAWGNTVVSLAVGIAETQQDAAARFLIGNMLKCLTAVDLASSSWSSTAHAPQSPDRALDAALKFSSQRLHSKLAILILVEAVKCGHLGRITHHLPNPAAVALRIALGEQTLASVASLLFASIAHTAPQQLELWLEPLRAAFLDSAHPTTSPAAPLATSNVRPFGFSDPVALPLLTEQVLPRLLAEHRDGIVSAILAIPNLSLLSRQVGPLTLLLSTLVAARRLGHFEKTAFEPSLSESDGLRIPGLLPLELYISALCSPNSHLAAIAYSLLLTPKMVADPVSEYELSALQAALPVAMLCTEASLTSHVEEVVRQTLMRIASGCGSLSSALRLSKKESSDLTSVVEPQALPSFVRWLWEHALQSCHRAAPHTQRLLSFRWMRIIIELFSASAAFQHDFFSTRTLEVVFPALHDSYSTVCDCALEILSVFPRPFLRQSRFDGNSHGFQLDDLFQLFVRLLPSFRSAELEHVPRLLCVLSWHLNPENPLDLSLLSNAQPAQDGWMTLWTHLLARLDAAMVEFIAATSGSRPAASPSPAFKRPASLFEIPNLLACCRVLLREANASHRLHALIGCDLHLRLTQLLRLSLPLVGCAAPEGQSTLADVDATSDSTTTDRQDDEEDAADDNDEEELEALTSTSSSNGKRAPSVTFIFRMSRQCCLLLEDVTEALFRDIFATPNAPFAERTAFVIKPDGVLDCLAAESVGILIAARHKGSIGIGEGVVFKLAERLWRLGGHLWARAEYSHLSLLPAAWLKIALEAAGVSQFKGVLATTPVEHQSAALDNVLAEATGRIAISRRSAGLPLLVASLLASSMSRSIQSDLLVRDVIDSILSAIQHKLAVAVEALQPSPTRYEAAPIESIVHLLNILRILVRDVRLVGVLQSFLARILAMALSLFEHHLWPVRNAATLLFSCLHPRVVGFTPQSTPGQRASSTLDELYQRYPDLRRQLEEICEKSNLDHGSSALHAAMMILCSLSPPPHPSQYVSSAQDFLASRQPLDAAIVRCSHSPLFLTRCSAARATIALVPSSEVCQFVCALIETLRAERRQNTLHGVLLQVFEVLSWHLARSSTAQSQQLATTVWPSVASLVWLIQATSVVAPAVQTCYLEISHLVEAHLPKDQHLDGLDLHVQARDTAAVSVLRRTPPASSALASGSLLVVACLRLTSVQTLATQLSLDQLDADSLPLLLDHAAQQVATAGLDPSVCGILLEYLCAVLAANLRSPHGRHPPLLASQLSLYTALVSARTCDSLARLCTLPHATVLHACLHEFEASESVRTRATVALTHCLVHAHVGVGEVGAFEELFDRQLTRIAQLALPSATVRDRTAAAQALAVTMASRQLFSTLFTTRPAAAAAMVHSVVRLLFDENGDVREVASQAVQQLINPALPPMVHIPALIAFFEAISGPRSDDIQLALPLSCWAELILGAPGSSATLRSASATLSDLRAQAFVPEAANSFVDELAVAQLCANAFADRLDAGERFSKDEQALLSTRTSQVGDLLATRRQSGLALSSAPRIGAEDTFLPQKRFALWAGAFQRL